MDGFSIFYSISISQRDERITIVSFSEMNREKTVSNDDAEFVDDSANLFPLTVIVAFLVVFVTIVILRLSLIHI